MRLRRDTRALRRLLACVVVGVCLLALPGCDSMQHHTFVWVQPVNGKPLLVIGNQAVLADRSVRFSVYRPTGEAYTDWESIAGERLGTVYGTFAYADEKGECLGLLHEGQLSLLRFPDKNAAPAPKPATGEQPAAHEQPKDEAQPEPGAKKDDPAPAPSNEKAADDPKKKGGAEGQAAPAGLGEIAAREPETTFHVMHFPWLAETGAQLGEHLYLFGSDIRPKFDRNNPNETRESPLRVARFDGKQIEELTIEGPLPRVLTNARGLYWMRAIPHGGKLHIFWRGAEIYGGLDMEPPVTMQGPLRHAIFDGKKFEPLVQAYQSLPDGTTVIWSQRGQLHVAVQPQDPTWGKSPSPMMYTLPAEGNVPTEMEMDARPRQKGLRFKFFDLERLPSENATVFLRSNGQRFEIWEADGRQWSVVTQPHGLPGHDLESALLGVLAICLFLVALGLGMAFRRRRQVLLVMEKLRAQDVLAPLSLRISAYLIDLAMVVVVTDILLRSTGQPPARWTNLVLSFVADPGFILVYVSYLTLMESYLGATVGKFMLGLRVISVHGERPSLWSSFVRNLVGYYERHFVVALFAAMPTILLTPRRQRLGDLLGHTLVVQKAAMEKYKTQREAELAKRWKLDGVPAKDAGGTSVSLEGAPDAQPDDAQHSDETATEASAESDREGQDGESKEQQP